MLNELSKQENLFHQQGFLIIPNALNCDEINNLVLHSELGKQASQGCYIRYSNLVFLIPKLSYLLGHHKTLPIVKKLMGSDPILQSSEFIQRPNTGDDNVMWHDDGPDCPSYRSLDISNPPLMQLKLGFYLTDFNNKCEGNLTVIPESHKWSHSPKLPSMGKYNSDEINKTHTNDSVEVLLKAGDVLLFHNALWHKVVANKGQEPKRMIYLAFCHRWMKPYLFYDYSMVKRKIPSPYQHFFTNYKHPNLDYEYTDKIFRSKLTPDFGNSRHIYKKILKKFQTIFG